MNYEIHLEKFKTMFNENYYLMNNDICFEFSEDILKREDFIHTNRKRIQNIVKFLFEHYDIKSK